MRNGCALIVGVIAALLPATGNALPSEATVTGVNDDATVTLTSWEEFIEGDSRSRCGVSIQVVGQEVPFTPGDSIQIWVEDDDLVFNDPVWQTDFEVTQEEIVSGLVERDFDCSAAVPSDLWSSPDLIARAEVVKERCGFFCRYDRPETSPIYLVPVEDDGAENDDSSSVAVYVNSGYLEDRVNRDQDWFEFSLPDRGNVTLGAVHDARYGRLDVALLDEDDRRVAEGQDDEGQTVLLATALAPGVYRARISPRQSNDFNFYDLRLFLDAVEDSCEPGSEDARPCGDCGTQRRVCGDDQQWGLFGGCEDQGVCSPGDERLVACDDMCGSLEEFCNESCAWHRPSDVCAGSGVCSLGQTDTRECEGGVEFRTCEENCYWTEWSACSARECSEGDVRECYDGPERSLGVGICREGRQRCVEGIWTACSAQIVPVVEACADGRDNDCDGKTDEEDPECQGEGAGLGSACMVSRECLGDLLCLAPPAHPQFVDGYCGDDDCTSAADCGDDGVCAPLFGHNHCLKICDDIGDCRRGYLCALVGGGVRACIPQCQGDDDCTDAAAPLCDVATGICVDAGAEPDVTDAGGGGGADADAGTGPAPGPPATSSGGCHLAGEGAPRFWLRR